MEKELEKFQHEMKRAGERSEQIIIEDQEEENFGKHISEIDEQIGEYERLNRLLERSERVAAVLEAGSAIKQEIMEVDEDDDGSSSGGDDDYVDDWRTKTAF